MFFVRCISQRPSIIPKPKKDASEIQINFCKFTSAVFNVSKTSCPALLPQGLNEHFLSDLRDQNAHPLVGFEILFNYTFSMKSTFEEVSREINALHYQRALSLLERNSAELLKSDPASYHYFTAQCLRGLELAASALSLAQLAISESEDDFFKDLCRWEIAKNLFKLGKRDDSEKELEKILSRVRGPRVPEASLTLAALCIEQGRTTQAREEVEQIVSYHKAHPDTKERWVVEMALMMGDIYSFQEDTVQARSWYDKALAFCETCIPENWRVLRKALIWHNIADLYEQKDDFQKADRAYSTALSYIQDVRDPEIYDVASYECEILLSIANFYSNQDDYDKAEHLFEAILIFQKDHPPVKALLLLARTCFLYGLCELYQDTERHRKRAHQLLENAYQIHSALYDRGEARLEQVGRCAYYLADVLDDLPENYNRKENLLIEASNIFQKLWRTEPRFYLSSIAEIFNEIGRIKLLQNDPKAVLFLEKASDYFTHVRKLFRDDPFILESQTYSCANLARAYDLNQDLDKAQDCLSQVLRLCALLINYDLQFLHSVHLLLTRTIPLYSDRLLETRAGRELKGSLSDLEDHLFSA